MTNEDDRETLSVVIPVYSGADTVGTVVDELIEVCDGQAMEGMHLVEVILVHDGARDDSATAIQRCADSHARVTAVWLSRNFGQHAATLAGCSSTVGDWIVTMDEDGMHDPRAIAKMRRAATTDAVRLVYAHATDTTHARWRSLSSSTAKWITRSLFGVRGADDFASFRLLDGYTMRALAAYCGPDVYLDVALQWVFPTATRVDLPMREGMREASGYSLRRLLSHFRRMVVTAGTRPLRLASGVGFGVAALGVLATVVLVLGRLTGAIPVVPGWTSVMVAMSTLLGIILLVLGVIAEYLSMALTSVSGRPPYLIAGRPPPQPPEA